MFVVFGAFGVESEPDTVQSQILFSAIRCAESDTYLSLPTHKQDTFDLTHIHGSSQYITRDINIVGGRSHCLHKVLIHLCMQLNPR